MRAPPGCGSCSPPAMTCGWACTGCGWRGSSPRSARPTCGSPCQRRGRCSKRPGWSCPTRPSALLYERTEGWAAGLRLAALSLAGHPDPERFAAEFSGSERTVAEYLLAEVLERQQRGGAAAAAADLGAGPGERRTGRPADRRLGRGADLAAARAGQRVRGLAGCAAVLVPLPPAVRRPAAAGAAAQRAGRTARAARRRRRVVRRSTGTRSRRSGTPRRRRTGAWPPACCRTTGSASVSTGWAPPRTSSWPRSRPASIAADAELAALTAGAELARGSLEEAERYLALATERLASVPADRRGRVAGRARGRAACGWPGSAGTSRRWPRQAQRLLAPAGAAGPAQLGLGEDLRALALINLGIAELWTARFDEADRHLEQGVALARRIGRPYPGDHRPGVLGAAGQLAVVPAGGAAQQAGDRAGRAARLDRGAGRRGRLPGAGCRADRPGPARGGERALERAERTLRAEVEPAAGMRLRYGRGLLELAAAVTPRWAPSRPPSGWPGCSSPSTRWAAGCARTCCRRSCGWAKRSAPNSPGRDGRGGA